MNMEYSIRTSTKELKLTQLCVYLNEDGSTRSAAKIETRPRRTWSVPQSNDEIGSNNADVLES